MIVHVFSEGRKILLFTYNSPRFWRRARNMQKLHIIDHIFEERNEIPEIVYSMFLEKGNKFLKLHTIVHVFREGKEVPKIAYDSQHFLGEGKKFQKLHMIDHIFWKRERNSRNCL